MSTVKALRFYIVSFFKFCNFKLKKNSLKKKKCRNIQDDTLKGTQIQERFLFERKIKGYE